MFAMRLHSTGKLEADETEAPQPGAGQVRLRVTACGVCRTDLHVVDGDLAEPKPQVIPGHEIVGVIDMLGDGVDALAVGDRVGVPWLGFACGTCEYCTRGQENLCLNALFTGYQIDGGYAEYAVADHRFCFLLPEHYDDQSAAPLLCAGLIGHRAYRMAGDAARIGLYGFGAAAHILCQVARWEGREVYAFTRDGDTRAQAFACELGACWAGESREPPPRTLDAAIIFAPVGELVPQALASIRPGGTVVCAGIHMSDIPSFAYALLWEERSIRSVANLTREDAIEFLNIAPRVPVATHTTAYALKDANRALDDLRAGRLNGAAVLRP